MPLAVQRARLARCRLPSSESGSLIESRERQSCRCCCHCCISQRALLHLRHTTQHNTTQRKTPLGSLVPAGGTVAAMTTRSVWMLWLWLWESGCGRGAVPLPHARTHPPGESLADCSLLTAALIQMSGSTGGGRDGGGTQNDNNNNNNNVTVTTMTTEHNTTVLGTSTLERGGSIPPSESSIPPPPPTSVQPPEEFGTTTTTTTRRGAKRPTGHVIARGGRSARLISR